jgi:hypothetical protein
MPELEPLEPALDCELDSGAALEEVLDVELDSGAALEEVLDVGAGAAELFEFDEPE